MDFVAINFPSGWKSHEAAEQMASDMCTLRTAYYSTYESKKEFASIIEKEKTAKCLHECLENFGEVSREFSVGFNSSSGTILAQFRQNHYRSILYPESTKKTQKDAPAGTQLHDPTRIFFNSINLCVDCMLKIFAKSPLPVIICFHHSFKSYTHFSGHVSWLKLLYYPPMLKRMVRSGLDKSNHDYVECAFFSSVVWCYAPPPQRIELLEKIFKCGDHIPWKTTNYDGQLCIFDDDAKYILVRYTLIFVMGIMKNYFSLVKIKKLWDKGNREFQVLNNLSDLECFNADFTEFYTFCEQIDNLDRVLQLCFTFVMIAITIKYPHFFTIKLFSSESGKRHFELVVNRILLHHRKNTISCRNCGKYGEHIKLCKGCKVIYYCSKKCQKVDWRKRHRLNCKGIRKLWWTRKYNSRKLKLCSKHFDLF